VIEVRTSDDLRRVTRELRRMDSREVTKRFRKELRAAATPLVPVVRASIQSIPSRTGDGSLRAAMSKAVRVEVRTTGRQAGIAIRVDGRKMPAHMKSLPSMVEGKKRWRHPVFGNRQVWVQQPSKPYFYKVVRPAGASSRRAVNRVLDGITQDIS
jgi:hypothetical protein